MKNTAVLLLSTPMCLARKGVVAAISQFMVAHKGSILHSDDHADCDRDLFLSRLEWDLEGFDIPIPDFEHHFKPLAERFLIKYHLEELLRKGRDLEKVVLSRAVRWHLENRVLVYQNKTVVFA